MVYVRPDGSVSNRRSIWRVIQDFISTIIGAVSLFVTAVFNPPQLEVRFAVFCGFCNTEIVSRNVFLFRILVTHLLSILIMGIRIIMAKEDQLMHSDTVDALIGAVQVVIFVVSIV
jgi:hypothetical protein